MFFVALFGSVVMLFIVSICVNTIITGVKHISTGSTARSLLAVDIKDMTKYSLIDVGSTIAVLFVIFMESLQ